MSDEKKTPEFSLIEIGKFFTFLVSFPIIGGFVWGFGGAILGLCLGFVFFSAGMRERK